MDVSDPWADTMALSKLESVPIASVETFQERPGDEMPNCTLKLALWCRRGV
jgi:hypothetical protein